MTNEEILDEAVSSARPPSLRMQLIIAQHIVH